MRFFFPKNYWEFGKIVYRKIQDLNELFGFRFFFFVICKMSTENNSRGSVLNM